VNRFFVAATTVIDRVIDDQRQRVFTAVALRREKLAHAARS